MNVSGTSLAWPVTMISTEAFSISVRVILALLALLGALFSTRSVHAAARTSVHGPFIAREQVAHDQRQRRAPLHPFHCPPVSDR